MVKQLKRKPLYFTSLLFVLIFLIFCSLLVSKQQSFIFLNSYHDAKLDLFFINFTWFGDGLISILTVIILAVFRKRKIAAALLLAYTSSGISAQFLKHWFNQPRPIQYFEQTGFHFHFIENISIHREFSFPSGHTSSAFALAIVFALGFNDRRISLLFILLALMEGFSRIYLGEHFLTDVVAGMFLGIIFGLLSDHIISLKKHPMISRLTKRITSTHQILFIQFGTDDF